MRSQELIQRDVRDMWSKASSMAEPSMLRVCDLPSDVDVPDARQLIVGRPAHIAGLPITWNSPEREVVPVLLHCWTMPDATTRCFLFGAKHDLAGAWIAGTASEGYIPEYIVIETRRDGEAVVHRLQQRATSIVYSEECGDAGAVLADEVVSPDSLAVRGKGPAWKATDMEWPTMNGEVMRYLGQVTLGRHDVLRTWFDENVEVFVFWASSHGRNIYAVVCDENLGQTAEDHYDQEARRGEWEP